MNMRKLSALNHLKQNVSVLLSAANTVWITALIHESNQKVPKTWTR